MVHIIKQQILNPSTKNSDSLQKLIKALNKDCVSMASAFNDYKFTVFYNGKSSTFYARQFHDTNIPGIFTERRFNNTTKEMQLSDPQELNVKEILITENNDYKQIAHKVEMVCLSLMEKDLTESGRYNDMIDVGGIPRTDALRYCMFEKIYPEIEFFKMPAKYLKIAVHMVASKELHLNLYNRKSLTDAMHCIKKKMKTEPTETEVLYSKFGKRLADHIIQQRKYKTNKFYQLSDDTLEQLVYCEDKEYERYRFILTKQEIDDFDRLIESQNNKHVIVIVFKDIENNERAVVVDTRKKRKVPFNYVI